MNWKEKLPEIIIGIVLLGGAGWLITQTYTINRGLGTLEAKVDAGLNEQTGRINRIVEVLPDIRVRIAKEELSKPLMNALVVLSPVQTSRGKWFTSLHLIDVKSKTRNSYVVSLQGPEDRDIIWLAGGAVAETDPSAVSFKTLATFSSDIGTPAASPSYVLDQNSYVFSKGAASTASLKALLQRRSVTHTSAAIPAGMNSWEKLTVELAKNPDQYMVKSKQ